MGQYWLGKTKLSDRPKMPSTSYYRILLFNGIFYWLIDQLTNYVTNCLPACLMSSDHVTQQWLRLCTLFFHCSMSLQPARCLLAYHSTYNTFFMDLPVPSFVFHSSLLTGKSVDSVVARDGFLFLTEKKFCIFHTAYLVAFQILLDLYLLVMTAGNEV